MRLIERYLFRQFLGPTLLATLALVALALLARSLSEFDVLIEQRQSAMVFLKIITLALPQLLGMILPIALFVATLVALNRLHTEQEIVVCFAGGMSRWRVISPAIRLAVFATLFSLGMSLWAAPWSSRAIRETFFDIKSDLASTLVRPGEFTEPGPGLTVYAQTIDRDQIIHNLFIHQEKPNGGAITYTAREGVIGERKGLPVLILRKGSNQEFSSDGVLQYLSWDEYTFDLSSLFQSDELLHYKIGDRYPARAVLPRPDPGMGKTEPGEAAFGRSLAPGQPALQSGDDVHGRGRGDRRLVQPHGLWPAHRPGGGRRRDGPDPRFRGEGRL
jgi:lipopolysaccharide export system permease protein